MWPVESAEGEGDEAWKMEESGEEMLHLLLVPLHERSGMGLQKLRPRILTTLFTK